MSEPRVSGNAKAEERKLIGIPTLPLRDMVIYPHGVHPLFVGTQRSIAALEAAMAADKQVLLLAKRDAAVDEPTQTDLFEVGTVATILQLLKLPDDTVKVLVEGGQRAQVQELHLDGDFIDADVVLLAEPELANSQVEASVKALMSQFERYVESSKKVPAEVLSSLSSIDDPARLADTIAAQMTLKIEDKQAILEAVALQPRMNAVLDLIDAHLEVMQMGTADSRSRQKADGAQPARVLLERTDEGDSI